MTPGFHARWGAVNDRIGLWMSGRGPVTAEPDLAVHATFTGAELDRKVAAVRVHASQTTVLADEPGKADFRQWWPNESFVAAHRSGSRELGPVRPHRAHIHRSPDGRLNSWRPQ